MRRLVVVNGHPDPRKQRFCAALADAYARGGTAAGWRAETVRVGELALASLLAWRDGEEPDTAAADMLTTIEAADRLAIVFPLWFDKPPEPLTALFTRVAPRRAHVIVTMDMPAFAYRSILRDPAAAPMFAIPGVTAEDPVLIGCASSINAGHRRSWLAAMRNYGERTRLGSAPTPSRVQAFADRVSEFFA
jgi:putative NADPH-quinone reductase